MVGGDDHGIAALLGMLGHTGDVLADHMGRAELRLGIGRVSDDVAVGEVCQHEVIALVRRLHDPLGHLGQAQFRLLVKGNALGRRNADVRLAWEGLVFAAVEEERHMGILLALGTMELLQACLGDHLRQRLLHLFRRERDGQVLELLVIHGHDHEFQSGHVFPGKAAEIGIGERLGQLYLALAAAAAEHHAVAVLDLAHRCAVFVHAHHRLQKIIGLALTIGVLHCLRQRTSSAIAIAHHSASFIGGKISKSWEKC